MLFISRLLATNFNLKYIVNETTYPVVSSLHIEETILKQYAINAKNVSLSLIASHLPTVF